MDMSQMMTIMQQGILVAIKVAGPLLLVAIGVGLIISIFQAATQIHEQTLTFVPKLIAIALVLFAGGSWMLETMVDFVHKVFEMMIY